MNRPGTSPLSGVAQEVQPPSQEGEQEKLVGDNCLDADH